MKERETWEDWRNWGDYGDSEDLRDIPGEWLGEEKLSEAEWMANLNERREIYGAPQGDPKGEGCRCFEGILEAQGRIWYDFFRQAVQEGQYGRGLILLLMTGQESWIFRNCQKNAAGMNVSAGSVPIRTIKASA